MRSLASKSRRAFLCAALGCCLALPAAAQDKKPASSGNPEHDAMMAEMMKYAMPATEHQAMAKNLVGSWKTVSKSWMAPGDPMTSEGTSTCTAVLGGRFIQESAKGSMMGMPFEGMGLYGYDLYKKQYVGMWMDTMGTTYMTMTGTADAAGKTINWSGSWENPMTKKMETYRMVAKTVDDKTRVFEMWGDMGGKEGKMMEITYTRM